MVKISCISHFIDNLHAFETDGAGKKGIKTVNQHNVEETKRFKILNLFIFIRKKKQKQKNLHCIQKNMLINFIESIAMH